MIAIEPVPLDSLSPLQEHARALFRQYGQFLLETGSHDAHLPKLEEETVTLPAAYAERGGELLLALVDAEPAACIAYRIAGEEPRSCEIRRLFVLPAFRGHGLGRRLVAEAMTRAAARGFTRAILDTDAETMPAALALYRSMGFESYAAQRGNLSFLQCGL